MLDKEKINIKNSQKNNFSSQCAQFKSIEKDKKILNLLYKKINEIIIYLFTINFSLKNQNLIQFIIESGYFAVTTAQSVKTLGEEYTNVWLVKKYENTWFLLSFFDRVQLLFFKIAIPNLFQIMTNILSFNLHNPLFYFLVFLKQFYTQYFEQTRIIILFFSKIHLMVWYFNAKYLTFPERLLEIRYISEGKENVPHLTYVFPGIFLFIECFFRFFIWFKSLSLKKDFSHKTYYKRSNINSFKKNICQICLAPRFRPTATLCGHIFCWNCVCEALKKINRCPICRQEIKLQELICLNQYI